MGRLSGKKALVIGASIGIGREVCRVFAQEGADVAIADRGHAAEKESLLSEIRGWGRDACVIEVDVLVEAEVQAAIAPSVMTMPYAAASVGRRVPEMSSIAPTITTIVITVPRSGSTRISRQNTPTSSPIGRASSASV